MLGVEELKERIERTETTVECPVKGCSEKVERQTKKQLSPRIRADSGAKYTKLSSLLQPLYTRTYQIICSGKNGQT